MADLSSLLGAGILASSFPLAEWSRRSTKFKHWWGALSAGVAIAFMFVHVLPELAEHQPTVTASVSIGLLSAEKRIYAWALAGFVAFAALNTWRFAPSGDRTLTAGPGPLFFIRMAGFALYVLLIGYLLVHREDNTLLSLWLYAAAMGLHLFMLDVLLAEQFAAFYEPRWRVVLTAAVLLGWALGAMNALPEGFTSRLFAFVLGGVIITTAHEELGMAGTAHVWWFVAGAAVYATILLLI